MKKITYFILVATALFGCSSNPPATQTTTDTTSSSNLMKEGPAYNANQIDPSAPVVEVTLTATGNNMSEMKYDQEELHAKAGSTVSLKLKNSGTDASMIHNFVLIDTGTADDVAKQGLAAGADKNYIPKSSSVYVGLPTVGPGKETSLKFPAPPKGNYDFICTYPGHYQKMHGKFIVD